jgi:hypothetical protein
MDKWAKEHFKGKCPYTSKKCEDWNCKECLVERQERIDIIDTENLPMWDRLYNHLNDWRLSIGVDETTPTDERHDREVIYKTLGEVMEIMLEYENRDET